MTPDETQKILELFAGYWPWALTDEMTDAWATALVPVPYVTAQKALVAHARAENGDRPPTVAHITAAMRADQRGTSPTDQIIAGIRAGAESAARDNENHRRRIIRLDALTADQRAVLLAEATRQLRDETHSPVIPTRLAENRAADLLDQQ